MIGILADDLTGAAELGGVAWKYGLTAEVQTVATNETTAEVVAVDTNTRERPVKEAAELAALAARIACDDRRSYKKIDSVLRGPVLAEVQSICAALGFERCLVVPANPGLGRIIRDGRYFINDKPLDETDFRHDPRYPRQTSVVLDLLGAGGAMPVQLARPGAGLPRKGITVGEASTRDDLLAWAAQIDDSVLPVGGAEFFSAMLESSGHRPRSCAGSASVLSAPEAVGEWARTAGEHILFVCGSASASTRAFTFECRKAGVPVCSMPPEIWTGNAPIEEALREWKQALLKLLVTHRVAVLAIDQPPLVSPEAANRLQTSLVEVAKTTLEHIRVHRVFAEGGATAAALVTRMGWSRLRVRQELAPGVVELEVQSAPGALLTIKPGSYRWPSLPTLQPLA